MSLLCLSNSRYEKCVMCWPPRDQKILHLCVRLDRQMSDGGQQDHHCRLTVWGSAHWWIIDEGWLPSFFYSVQIDTYSISCQSAAGSFTNQLSSTWGRYFSSLHLYWLDKLMWWFRGAVVVEMNKVALARLLLFSLFGRIFFVPLQRWTQQVMIRGL